MKTAVQWLKEQYIDRGETLPLGVFQEALEMERDQIELAHFHNRCLNNQTYECSIQAIQNAEQYYKDMFKNEG